MSCCCCCCCVTPSGELLEGIRKKERLVRGREEEEEEECAGDEGPSRRNMDVSLLREQYRCTRETQRRHTQVLLFRTVSEELSEAVTIIPVTQGLTSPWEPNSSSRPAVTFDPDPTTYDPWHAHLELHRRSCPGFTALLPASSSETGNTSGSSRRSSSSSEAGGPRQDVDSPSDPPGCSRETSPCSSFEEEKLLSRSRGDPDPESSERPRGGSQKDQVQVSVSDDPQECSAAGSLTSSDGSSTPVASCSPSGSTTSLHEDQNQNRVAGRRTSNAAPQTGGPSRKFSAPALRFTRGVSVGGVGSSTGVHQNQNYHPFPSRKAPRISEAARRLGMYSSF